MSRLDDLFRDGPDGFLDGPLSRARRFVCATNDLPVEPGALGPRQPYPSPSPQWQPEQGPAWQQDAERAVVGLWSGDSRDIGPTLGFSVPQRFLDFERAVDGADVYRTFDELRLVSAQVRMPSDDRNLFEQVLLSDQLNYLGNGMAGLFAGTIPLGDMGNGDSFHLDLYAEDPQPMVLHWDHDRRFFSKVFAPDLQETVFLTALSKAAGDEELSDDVQAAAFASLRGRVSPTWHFSIDDHDDDFVPFKAEPGTSAALYLGFRARWIVALLEAPQVGAIEDVAEVFYENLNPVLAEEDLPKRLETIPSFTPTALYSIWRAYLFDEPHLEPFLEAAARNPARVVQDAVKLIRALLGGRTTLGRYHDWPATLARFRALDLDPARASAREAEAAVRRRRLELRRQGLAEELQGASRVDELAVCAEVFEQPDLNQLALKAILGTPGREPLRAALSLLIEGGCNNDSREAEDMVRRAAKSLDSATQLLITGIALHGSKMPDGERSFDGRKARDILAQSRVELHPEGHRAVVDALRALDPKGSLNTWQQQVPAVLAGALDVQEAVPVLNGLLASLPDDDSFHTSLNHADFMLQAMTALRRLKPDDLTQVKRYARVGGLRPGKLRCAAALTLAELDPAALDLEVCEALKISVGRNDPKENAPALFALARSPHREAMVGLKPYADRYPESQLGLALLEERPVDSEVAACLSHYGYNDDSDLSARGWALEAIELFDLPVPADVLRSGMGRDPGLDMRLAAAGGLESPRWIDRLDAEAMTVEERIATLADDEVYGREACAMLLVEVPEARQALEAAVALLADEPKVRGRPGYLHRYCVEALISLPEEASTVNLLAGVLRDGSSEHRDPILRDPPDWAGLRPAMEAALSSSGGWMKSTIQSWLEAHADA